MLKTHGIRPLRKMRRQRSTLQGKATLELGRQITASTQDALSGPMYRREIRLTKSTEGEV